MAEVKMENLKPNSNKYKEERKKMAPVVHKDALVSEKHGFLDKLIGSFIKEDFDDLKDYILWEKIVPGLQYGALDIISMILIKEPYSRGSSSGRTNYRGFYSGSSQNKTTYKYGTREEKRNEYVDYKKIILRNRREAEDVVSAMQDEIKENGYATVAQLLELVDAPSKYTDCSFGWDDVRDISIKRIAPGFLIDVREAKNLDY